MSEARPVAVVTSDNVVLVGQEALDMAETLDQENVRVHVLNITSDRVSKLNPASFARLIEECHRRLEAD